MDIFFGTAHLGKILNVEYDKGTDFNGCSLVICMSGNKLCSINRIQLNNLISQKFLFSSRPNMMILRINFSVRVK